MNTFKHTPILPEPIVKALVRPGVDGVIVDGTVGGGGHAHALLTAVVELGVDVRLIGLDRDPSAIAAARERLAPFGDRAEVLLGNHRNLPALMAEHGIPRLQGLLVDAGVSSHQLDTPERGFSFRAEGPLDMRMGPDAQTAAELLDTLDEEGLARVLGRYGEIRGAFRVARKLLTARRAGTLETTSDLAALVDRPLGRRTGTHPATQIFQALRIAANDELGALEDTVQQLGDVLAPGGRAAFISFHSLEDRIVKHGLRELVDPCKCPKSLPMCVCGVVPVVKLVSKLIRPDAQEIEDNPRSRSARLRLAERL